MLAEPLTKRLHAPPSQGAEALAPRWDPGSPSHRGCRGTNMQADTENKNHCDLINSECFCVGPPALGPLLASQEADEVRDLTGPNGVLRASLGRGAGGGSASHKNRDSLGILRRRGRYTSSRRVWALPALEQNFSQSLRSSEKTNTEEASPVKSNKSAKR